MHLRDSDGFSDLALGEALVEAQAEDLALPGREALQASVEQDALLGALEVRVAPPITSRVGTPSSASGSSSDMTRYVSPALMASTTRSVVAPARSASSSSVGERPSSRVSASLARTSRVLSS